MREVTVGEIRELAGEVLENVELRSVFLLSATHSNHPPSESSEISAVWTIHLAASQTDAAIEVKVRYEAYAVDSTVLPQEGEIDSEVLDEHYLWRSESEWMIIYANSTQEVPRFGKPQLDAFAMVMGPPNAHPYARQHLQSMTAMGPYPAFTMELFTPVTSFPNETVFELSETSD